MENKKFELIKSTIDKEIDRVKNVIETSSGFDSEDFDLRGGCIN